MRSRLYHSILTALLPFIWLQMLLPNGFMPGHSANGATLVMCSGTTLHQTKSDKTPINHHDVRSPCQFATSSSPALSASTTIFIAAIDVGLETDPIRETSPSNLLSLAYRPRGPPNHSIS